MSLQKDLRHGRLFPIAGRVRLVVHPNADSKRYQKDQPREK